MRTMRWSSLLAACVLVVSCSPNGRSSTNNGQGTLVLAARVFDGAEFHSGHAVLVDGDTISALGPAEELRKEAEDAIDLGDATLLPGVIDLHVHLGAAGYYKDLPEEGVTTVRDLATRAIVDEAHTQGLKVTAHVDDAAGARRALKAGVDEWAHIPCREVRTGLLDRAVARGVDAVATLHVTETGCPAALRNASAFVGAGGTLLYGSDLGNAGIPFGIDVQEMELMMGAGLSLEETLASATSLAGEALGLSPLGSLSLGAPADLIAVKDDVRTNLSVLSEPTFVMTNGDVIVEPDR